ncbi:MAG: ATP-binding cassette domain-containing protein [Prevotella sp.]|jgi:NitT/TauT family transport system ATP-binding protein|nr:ATP-binding cassette domain-containing protein [Prevotella sp.]
MIDINNISFKYSDSNFQVFEDLSMYIPDSKPTAVLGPSGCGKSTLLRCITGFLKIDKGEIKINGIDSYIINKNKKIGFAFQETALLDWKNVEENIFLPETIGKQVMTAEEHVSQMHFLLELIGLKKFKKYYPSQLSGGMKQRVNLARSLFTKPELLLLDEPFAALDLLTRTKLAINLREMIDKLTTPTILVTHSIEEAVIFADRIIILSNAPATVREIISKDFRVDNQKALESPLYLSTVAKCRQLLLED